MTTVKFPKSEISCVSLRQSEKKNSQWNIGEWNIMNISSFVDQKEYVVRLWGIEKLIKILLKDQGTSEHARIVDLLKLF